MDSVLVVNGVVQGVSPKVNIKIKLFTYNIIYFCYFLCYIYHTVLHFQLCFFVIYVKNQRNQNNMKFCVHLVLTFGPTYGSIHFHGPVLMEFMAQMGRMRNPGQVLAAELVYSMTHFQIMNLHVGLQKGLNVKKIVNSIFMEGAHRRSSHTTFP